MVGWSVGSGISPRNYGEIPYLFPEQGTEYYACSIMFMGSFPFRVSHGPLPLPTVVLGILLLQHHGGESPTPPQSWESFFFNTTLANYTEGCELSGPFFDTHVHLTGFPLLWWYVREALEHLELSGLEFGTGRIAEVENMRLDDIGEGVLKFMAE